MDAHSEMQEYPAGQFQMLCINFAFKSRLKTKNMTSKTAKKIYWIGSILTSLWFGASGFLKLPETLLFGT